MPSRCRAPPVLLFRHATIEAGGPTHNDAPPPIDDGAKGRRRRVLLREQRRGAKRRRQDEEPERLAGAVPKCRHSVETSKGGTPCDTLQHCS